MKNQNRLEKINNLYSKLLLCSKEISPEYYANLRKSLILEKITGMLTSEVDFESPDKLYYSFNYGDFKILHSILANNKTIQNGIDYIYGMMPYISEDNKKVVLTRLTIKIGIDQYLFMSCSEKREITAEIIFFEDSKEVPSINIDSYKNEYSDSFDYEKFEKDKILIKLSPRPTKILNILEFMNENIDTEVLENNDIKIESKTGTYSFKEFIRDTNNKISPDIPYSVFTEPRPMITCNDGFKISVQASSYNACEPKLNGLDVYKSFEVLSKKQIDDLALYLSDDNYLGKNKKRSTINQYNYVPGELLESIIENHGGIDKDKTFENYTNQNTSELKKLAYAKKIIQNNINA